MKLLKALILPALILSIDVFFCNAQPTKISNEIFSNIEVNGNKMSTVYHLHGGEADIERIFGTGYSVEVDRFVRSKIFNFNSNLLVFNDEQFSSLIIKNPAWKLKIGSTTITKDTYFYTLYSISNTLKTYDNKSNTSLKNVLLSPIDNPSGVYILIQISKSTNKIVEIKYGYPS